jgi:hypothetical protein
MTEALSSPHIESPMHPPPGLASSKPVEIIAPNRYCADRLLEDAARLFPAEILPGPVSIVRLQPPAGGEWVLETLSLVERWLDSIPLPCTKVLYGDRSYLIRASTGVARSVNAL